MTFDFLNFEKIFSENDISLSILCSPYNPCGTVFTKEELTELPNLYSKYKIVSCSDEIHSDFVLDIDKKHIPTTCISETASRGVVPHVNTLGLMAPAAAYEKCEEWLADLISYLRNNRDYLEEQINQLPGLKLNHIEATYLAWIDVSETGLENPVQFFENAGVGLSCGSFFGQKGFVRLNFGCPRSRLEQAIKIMKTALNNIKH